MISEKTKKLNACSIALNSLFTIEEKKHFSKVVIISSPKYSKSLRL